MMPRIVIMDDDALMRGLLAEWLAAEGYRVDAAARRDWRGDTPVDLVIVDVYMPRHLGNERLHAVRRAYPGVPIIAMSGQFCAGVRRAGPAAEALGVERVIAKPFGREALLEVVRSMIGPPPDGPQVANGAPEEASRFGR
jgi:DNA-binding response OmpR family regulator